MSETGMQTDQHVVDTRELRKILHELANLFTAVLITSGLLGMKAGDVECTTRYSRELLESGERGAVLVRRARSIVIPPEERMESGKNITVHSDANHAEKPVNQPAKAAYASRAPIDKIARGRMNTDVKRDTCSPEKA